MVGYSEQKDSNTIRNDTNLEYEIVKISLTNPNVSHKPLSLPTFAFLNTLIISQIGQESFTPHTPLS